MNPIYPGRKLCPGGTDPSYYLNPSVNQIIGHAPQQGIYQRRRLRDSYKRFVFALPGGRLDPPAIEKGFWRKLCFNC